MLPETGLPMEHEVLDSTMVRGIPKDFWNQMLPFYVLSVSAELWLFLSLKPCLQQWDGFHMCSGHI